MSLDVLEQRYILQVLEHRRLEQDAGGADPRDRTFHARPQTQAVPGGPAGRGIGVLKPVSTMSKGLGRVTMRADRLARTSDGRLATNFLRFFAGFFEWPIFPSRSRNVVDFRKRPFRWGPWSGSPTQFLNPPSSTEYEASFGPRSSNSRGIERCQPLPLTGVVPASRMRFSNSEPILGRLPRAKSVSPEASQGSVFRLSFGADRLVSSRQAGRFAGTTTW